MIQVSETFVRYALEAANKLVYQHRSERYQNAAEDVRNAIEARNDMIDAFIDNYIISIWDWINWDAYDIVDSWYGWDERSYEDVWKEIYQDKYEDEEEDEDYPKEYKWTSGQIEEIENWCMENNYWYDESYEVVVQDAFTF